MSARNDGGPAYPKVGQATYKPKWAKLRVQHPKNAAAWQCSVCAGPATHAVFVEVDWFRGNDEGPFKACRDHKGAAGELLSARAAITKAEAQP